MNALRVFAVSLAVLVLAAGAEAGPRGQWSRLPGTVINFAEPGLARSADGVLHVLYVRDMAARDDLVHVPIRPNGAVGAATAALDGWRTLNHPDLLRMPDGSLRTFFGGIRSTTSGEPNRSLNTATAPASGSEWTLQVGKASQSNSAYTGASTGAGLARDGTPISAWASTGELGFHYGVDPADPDRTVPQMGCCLYQPDIATDSATGQTYLGFFSLERGREGVYVQRISPAGVQGGRVLAPGTRVRGNAVNPGGRTSLTARLGAPGVFLAHGRGYPTYSSVALWRVGAPRPQIVVKADRAEHVNVAAAPQGRLWLMWERSGTIYATRTNRAANRLGAVNTLRPPGGGTIFRLNGEGSAGPLDLVANVRSGGQGLWHQQVWPKLTLIASTRRSGAGRTVTFRVLDAGDPVAGAVVRVAGRSLRTAVNGTATLRQQRSSPLRATATRPGYASATGRVR